MPLFVVELLVISGIVLLAWHAFLGDIFVPKEVRRLRRMKRALEAQLKAKRDVLLLRRELGDLQAELDAQETADMSRIEDLISSIKAGERPRFDKASTPDDGRPARPTETE